MRKNNRHQFDHFLKSLGFRRSTHTSSSDPCNRYQTLLTAYVDGQLDDKRKHVIEGHLNACAECRASLAVTRLVGHAITERPSAPFTGDMSARLRMAIAEEARQSVRAPFFTPQRLAWGGAAFTLAVVSAFALHTQQQPHPTTIAINPQAVITAPSMSANHNNSVVPSSKAPLQVAKVPTQLEPKVAPMPVAAINRIVTTVRPTATKGAPTTVVASLPYEKPMAPRKPVARPITNTAVAKLDTGRPAPTSTFVAPTPEPPTAAVASATPDTASTPVSPAAPEHVASADRAPANVVARNTDPAPSFTSYETGSAESVSLGRRLRNAGRVVAAHASVSVDHANYRQGNGTANIVDAVFK
ncbi:MAG TPA: zf-HC2 domain-containing protein [Capsulimonadaceae bacterium]|jgi:anti-sigma factor RsiW